MVEQLTNPERY